MKKVLDLAIAAAIAGSAQAGTINFTTTAAPTSDLDKRTILHSQIAVVDGKPVRLNYNTILRSGDAPKGSAMPFGTVIDKSGKKIRAADGSVFVSSDNDFSSKQATDGERPPACGCET